eukprot:253933_1
MADSSNDLNPLLPHANSEREKEHSKVLEDTEKVSNAFIVSSSIGFFGESMMLSTWILFAQTMDGCTYESIAVLVFLQSILQIVGVLFSSFLADKYSFDTITIFTSTLLLISVLVHSVSFSIVTLGIGVCLKAFVMDDIEVLSLGFIGKLLPFDTAAVHTGNWYAFTTITYLLGIIAGGLLSSYSFLSYRLVMIIASVIVFLRWIYILLKIRNTQNALTQKQLQFIEYYSAQPQPQKREEEDLSSVEKTWFPLCLERIRATNTSYNVVMEDAGNPVRKWLELTLNLTQFGFISCYVNVTFQFLALYMLDRFGLSVFLTTTQIIAAAISFGVLSFIMPDYVKQLSLAKKYALALPFYVIIIAMFMFAIPLTEKKYIYLLWVWLFILGTCLGALFVISELCILELQPKQHTGKINGIKTAIRFAVAAVVAALIAYFWNYGDEYIVFCYFQGIVYIVALVVNIMLMSIRMML